LVYDVLKCNALQFGTKPLTNHNWIK